MLIIKALKSKPTSAAPEAPMAVKWCGWIAEECGRIGKGPSAFVHFCTTWKPDQKGFQCRQNVGCGWCRAEWIHLPHEKRRADVLLGGLLGYHRSWAWQPSPSPDLG